MHVCWEITFRSEERLRLSLGVDWLEIMCMYHRIKLSDLFVQSLIQSKSMWQLYVSEFVSLTPTEAPFSRFLLSVYWALYSLFMFKGEIRFWSPQVPVTCILFPVIEILWLYWEPWLQQCSLWVSCVICYSCNIWNTCLLSGWSLSHSTFWYSQKSPRGNICFSNTGSCMLWKKLMVTAPFPHIAVVVYTDQQFYKQWRNNRKEAKALKCTVLVLINVRMCNMNI